jgi:hypothetical protein
MWRASVIVVLVGCGGGGMSPPPSDSGPDPVETPSFTPAFCAGGLPGDPGCPLNVLPLDDFGAAGARMSFTVTPLATGLLFDDIEFAAGPDGLHVERPQFVIEGVAAGDPYASVVLDIAPEGTASLDASTAVIQDTTGRVAVRFDAVGPLAR